MTTHPNRRWDGIDELYRELVPGLKRLAYLITGDAEFAEDAVHDAFLNVVIKVPDLNDADHIHRYLQRAVVNQTRKSWRSVTRRQRRHEAYAATQPGVHVDRSALPDPQVIAALQSLTVRHRAVLVLTYFCDYDDHRIADLMKCPLGTVKSTRSRALAAIRKVYPDDQFSEQTPNRPHSHQPVVHSC